MENIKSGVAIIILNYNSWQLKMKFQKLNYQNGHKL